MLIGGTIILYVSTDPSSLRGHWKKEVVDISPYGCFLHVINTRSEKDVFDRFDSLDIHVVQGLKTDRCQRRRARRGGRSQKRVNNNAMKYIFLFDHVYLINVQSPTPANHQSSARHCINWRITTRRPACKHVLVPVCWVALDVLE